MSDLYSEYFAIQGAPLGRTRTGGRIASFELYRTIERMRSTWFEPSPQRLALFDARYAARPAGKSSRLADGMVSADAYCTEAGLRCDFVPAAIGTVPSHAGRKPKPEIAQTYRRQYPRLDVLASQIYRDALGLRLNGRVHDLTAVFDHSPGQFFIDEVHLNEAGKRGLVDELLPIVTAKAPAK